MAEAADAILTRHAPIPAATIARLGSCRVLARYGTGHDNIDVAAAAATRSRAWPRPSDAVSRRSWASCAACGPATRSATWEHHHPRGEGRVASSRRLTTAVGTQRGAKR